MPTERKRAIRTATAWNADQAAMEALYGVGGYYTSLSLWEAGEQDNLVNLDQIRTGVCYNDWPSGLSDNVEINGWTTDATRYVKITVAEGHRHNGTPRSGFWMTRSSGAMMVRFQVPHCEAHYLDVKETSGNTNARGFYATQENSKIFFCISEVAYSTNSSALNINCIGSTCTVIGCLGIGGYHALRVRNGRMENCVATGAYIGIAREGFDATVFKNNVAYGNTSLGFGSGTYGTLSRNNASDDATATGASPAGGSVTGVTSAAFANAASNDFHLSAGSVLRGAGANLYSNFQTDVDGDTWPSSGAWDIGFDYYVESGGSLTIDSITASLVTSSGARITLGVTR